MYKRAVAATAVCKAVDATDGVTARTGLTITCKISKDGGAFATIATPVAEIGLGWYLISLTGTEMTAESIALESTATGALIAGIPIHTEADYTAARAAFLDAAISTRSTYAGGAVASVTAAVTVGTNNDKTGYALSSAGVQAVWDALTSALTTVGSIGKRIADYLTGDAFARLGAPAGASIAADIATRSTYAGADTSGTTTLLSRLTSTRAVLMDNLDAAVSTRLASASYTAPPSAATNATAVRTELATELGRIDVATSTRLTSGTVASDVTAIKAKTDNLPAAPASSGDVSTVGAAVAAVDAKVGTPAGASVSADLAAVKTDTAAVKTKTDPLTFTIANKVDANIRAVNDVNVTGSGAPSDPWGP